MRVLIRKIAFALVWLIVPGEVFTQTNDPVIPLGVGNKWYYNARDDTPLLTNHYGTVKKIIGFTPDSFAIVQVELRYTDHLSTGTEYWREVNGDFYMGSSPTLGTPVFKRAARDSVVQVITSSGVCTTTSTWSPSLLSFWGTNFAGQSLVQNTHCQIIHGGSTEIVLRDVAIGLGLVRLSRTFSYGPIGTTKQLEKLRGAFINGVLLGDTSFTLPLFPQILSGTGTIGSPPSIIGTVKVKNPLNSTLTITSVESSNPVFQATQQSFILPPLDSTTVSVTFSPNQVGYAEGRLTFRTAEGISNLLQVFGTGYGAIAGYTKRQFTFGDVRVGNAKKDTILMGNYGNAGLTVSIAGPQQGTFSVVFESPIQTIPPGIVVRLVGQFTPTEARQYTDTIRVFTNSITGTIDTLTLTGTGIGSADIRPNDEAPKEFALAQNYPNPFNPATIIKFQIPNSSFVTLKVFDLLGREVATLVNEEMKPGIFERQFKGSNLSSGIYLYQLRAGSFIETKKLVLLR